MKEQRCGQYVLEGHIANGGMGEVYRARRTGAAAFSRQVCIKRMHKQLSDDPEFLALFLDEARTGSKLRHRNIVAIEDLGEHEGQYFIAMEFVNGVDLSKVEQALRTEGQTMPVDAAIFVAHELLSALSAAHHALDPDDGHPLRVVHRDVSPHNTLVSFTGEVKLTDFGIALSSERSLKTQGDVARGRFGYMPLEQAKVIGQDSAGLDARADLFALGVTLFELLTGTHPFRIGGVSLPSVVAAQLADDRPALASLRPDLPPPLINLVERMLSRDAADRPADASEALGVVSALPEFASGAHSLAAVMARLYPGEASVIAVSRSSIPVPRSIPPPAARTPSNPSGSLRPPAPDTAVDPHGPTTARAVLELVGEEQSAPPRTLDASRVESGSSHARGTGAPTWVYALGAAALMTAATIGVVQTRRAHGLTEGAPRAAASSAADAGVARDETPVVSPAVTAPPTGNTAAPPAITAPTRPEHTGEHRPASRASNGEVTAPSTPEHSVVVATPDPRDGVDAGSAADPVVAAPVPGTLRVIALPWGEVTVDGASRGRAPVTLHLGAGEHSVRITGGVEHTERVVIRSGDTRTVRAEAE